MSKSKIYSHQMLDTVALDTLEEVLKAELGDNNDRTLGEISAIVIISRRRLTYAYVYVQMEHHNHAKHICRMARDRKRN